jgi:hypothetical protein
LIQHSSLLFGCVPGRLALPSPQPPITEPPVVSFSFCRRKSGYPRIIDPSQIEIDQEKGQLRVNVFRGNENRTHIMFASKTLRGTKHSEQRSQKMGATEELLKDQMAVNRFKRNLEALFRPIVQMNRGGISHLKSTAESDGAHSSTQKPAHPRGRVSLRHMLLERIFL